MKAALLVGAGPAGIAVAAELEAAGLSFDWIDRQGKVGGAYRRIYAELKLASPKALSLLPGMELPGADAYAKASELKASLERLAKKLRSKPRRAGLKALLSTAQGYRADLGLKRAGELYASVIVATGMFDAPKLDAWPAKHLLSPGTKLMHAANWQGPAKFKGQQVLVVGGGVSGIEIAEECARAGVVVQVVARGGKVKTVPQALLGLDIHRWTQWVEWLPNWLAAGFCRRHDSLPGSDLGFERFHREGLIRVSGPLPDYKGFGAVVLATGYRFDTPFLPKEVARFPKGHPKTRACQSVSHPGLFFAGFPCGSRLDSEFIRGMGRDARLIVNNLKERHGSLGR